MRVVDDGQPDPFHLSADTARAEVDQARTEAINIQRQCVMRELNKLALMDVAITTDCMTSGHYRIETMRLVWRERAGR